MTDKDPDPRFFPFKLFVFGRKFLVDRVLPPDLGQKFRTFGRHSLGLDHAFWNILGPLEGSGHKNPGHVGLKRGGHFGLGKTVVVKLNPQAFGEFFGPRRGVKPHRKDHHIVKIPVRPSVFGYVSQGQLAPYLIHPRHPGVDRPETILFHCPVKGLVKTLALSPDIHEEKVYLSLW